MWDGFISQHCSLHVSQKYARKLQPISLVRGKISFDLLSMCMIGHNCGQLAFNYIRNAGHCVPSDELLLTVRRRLWYSFGGSVYHVITSPSMNGFYAPRRVPSCNILFKRIAHKLDPVWRKYQICTSRTIGPGTEEPHLAPSGGLTQRPGRRKLTRIPCVIKTVCSEWFRRSHLARTPLYSQG